MEGELQEPPPSHTHTLAHFSSGAFRPGLETVPSNQLLGFGMGWGRQGSQSQEPEASCLSHSLSGLVLGELAGWGDAAWTWLQHGTVPAQAQAHGPFFVAATQRPSPAEALSAKLWAFSCSLSRL